LRAATDACSTSQSAHVPLPPSGRTQPRKGRQSRKPGSRGRDRCAGRSFHPVVAAPLRPESSGKSGREENPSPHLARDRSDKRSDRDHSECTWSSSPSADARRDRSHYDVQRLQSLSPSRTPFELTWRQFTSQAEPGGTRRTSVTWSKSESTLTTV